jgi:hypothetical protein
MAKDKSSSKHHLSFEAISVEGGIISPDWIDKIAKTQAKYQSEHDYHILKGLELHREITRYWCIAKALWFEFRSTYTPPTIVHDERVDTKAEAKTKAKAKTNADTKAKAKANKRLNKTQIKESNKIEHETNLQAQSAAEAFVLDMLKEVFGFKSITRITEPITVGTRKYPIGFTAIGGLVPISISPAGSGIDRQSLVFGDGHRRRSCFGLVQLYLNVQQETAYWGIASDGYTWRILRRNERHTREAWIEADLERIFREDRFADFEMLWLLCHVSRFGREGQLPTECILEIWRNSGNEEGTRAYERLRSGVEAALVALGQGFLSEPKNVALRGAIENRTLSVGDYFGQLLRLVYRLIFLLTIEERNLLFPAKTDKIALAAYAGGYCMGRVRDRSRIRAAYEVYHDLWYGTIVLFQCMRENVPFTKIPALSGIFDWDNCLDLEESVISNRWFLAAMYELAWLRDAGYLELVNYKELGPEELGSVYESLLELVPDIKWTRGGWSEFRFLGDSQGNARRTSGSYYTPDSLVRLLLDSTLEPVIKDTEEKSQGDAVEALLGS